MRTCLRSISPPAKIPVWPCKFFNHWLNKFESKALLQNPIKYINKNLHKTSVYEFLWLTWTRFQRGQGQRQRGRVGWVDTGEWWNESKGKVMNWRASWNTVSVLSLSKLFCVLWAGGAPSRVIEAKMAGNFGNLKMSWDMAHFTKMGTMAWCVTRVLFVLGQQTDYFPSVA